MVYILSATVLNLSVSKFVFSSIILNLFEIVSKTISKMQESYFYFDTILNGLLFQYRSVHCVFFNFTFMLFVFAVLIVIDTN